MKVNVFINGVGLIAPIDLDGSDCKPFNREDIVFLKCIEPEYKIYLQPNIARRMSRILKMGMWAAIDCVKKSGIEMPEAIIVGTGLGCVEDSQKFLQAITESFEQMRPPTAFIHSIHNTISGQIALYFRCHGYNSTYSHRGFSFESAMVDAITLIEEQEITDVLIGGLDEITEPYVECGNAEMLYGHKEYLIGEGATFLMLSSVENAGSLCKVLGMQMIYFPVKSQLEVALCLFLQEMEISLFELDLLVVGFVGDSEVDRLLSEVLNTVLPVAIPIVRYKQACGEYHTASAFGLALAASILFRQQIPRFFEMDNVLNRQNKVIDYSLIINQYRNKNFSFMLLSKC